MAYAAERIGLPSLNEKQKQAVRPFLDGKDVCQLTYRIWEVSLLPEYTVHVRLSHKQPVKLRRAINTPPTAKL